MMERVSAVAPFYADGSPDKVEALDASKDVVVGHRAYYPDRWPTVPLTDAIAAEPKCRCGVMVLIVEALTRFDSTDAMTKHRFRKSN